VGLSFLSVPSLLKPAHIFATVNVVLVVVWLGIALAIVRYMKQGPSATRIAA
jgi:hypothetical protein